jgi:hypothetical protein
MNKILSKLFSAGWWSTEAGLLIWLIHWLADVGLVAAAQSFVTHTVALWLVFTALMLLKRHAETHAWPKWAVKTLRALFVPAYIYDCWFNTRYGTIAFFEFPPERKNVVYGITIRHRFEPFTSRLKRHYLNSGWRGFEARIFCWLAHVADKRHCL